MARQSLDAETVDWVRRCWAIRRLSTRTIARLLGKCPRCIARVVRAGRPGCPPSGFRAYRAREWPTDAADRVRADLQAGRHPGPAVSSTKLTPEAVLWAREQAAAGERRADIAAQLHVSISLVSLVVCRRLHVTLPQPPDVDERGGMIECDADLPAMTGRIVGPDGRVYAHARAVEVATGWDRLSVANALANPTTGWRYELAPLPELDCSLLALMPDDEVL